MNFLEFNKQDEYCKKNNTPEGIGCDGCSGKNKENCADSIDNLCGQWIKALKEKDTKTFNEISNKLKKCGINSYGQLGILYGRIEFSK